MRLHDCGQVTKYALRNGDEELTSRNMSFCRKTFEENTERALNIIRSRLQALLESAPLPNKLLTKVFTCRYQRVSKFSTKILNNVSNNLIGLVTIDKNNKDFFLFYNAVLCQFAICAYRLEHGL